MLGLDENDYLIDIKFLNNYLYALQEQEKGVIRLLKLDIFGNIIYEEILEFNYGYQSPKLKVQNGKLYFSYSYYEYNYLDYVDVIEEVDSGLKRKELYKKYDKSISLVDFEILEKDIVKILFKYRNDVKSYCYKMFYKDSELLKVNGINKMEANFLCNDYVVSKSLNRIMVNKINSIAVIKDFRRVLDPKYEALSILDDYLVFINGFNEKHVNDLKMNFTDNLYGKYSVDYYFNENIDYLNSVNVDVLPFVGVENNKIYDVGVTLDGNAIARVNGELITFPYTINEVGDYKIELTGLNNISTILNIKVKKLRDEIIEKDNSDNLLISSNTNEINNSIQVSFETNNDLEKKSNNYLYFYLMPIMFLGLGFLFIKRG